MIPADTVELDSSKITEAAAEVRRLVLEHVVANNGGYLSQACSSAEILTTLYMHLMNLGPSLAPMVPPPFDDVPGLTNPDYVTGGLYNGAVFPEYDRFIFSPSHYALVLYATLVVTGRMAKDGLLQFNQDGSRVEMIGAEHSPGVETTTGSLGQALSQAGGIALGRKLKKESGRVFVFMTDGELQEGQTWEAFQALSHYQLDNVIVYFDMNGQQCDGPMDGVMRIGNAADRLRAFGAHVVEVDGHDIHALSAPLQPIMHTRPIGGGHMPTGRTTMPDSGKPLVILAHTDTTRGISLLKERYPKLHYVRFASEEERNRYREVLDSWRS